MGKIFIVLLLFLVSCLPETNPNQKYVALQWSYAEGSNWPYQTVVIDSCEYIFVQNGSASWGSHKGNCKFCAERTDKEQK
jgi:hypothetical protein